MAARRQETAHEMTGTAYRTPIQPDPPNPNAVEAIYAVYPLVSYPGREAGQLLETGHLLVSSCPDLGDTAIFPVEKSGRLVDYVLMASVPGASHERALHSIDYEPETVTPRPGVRSSHLRAVEGSSDV